MSSGVLFPGIGLLLFALGWPLATRRVAPNRWYGLRVPATFADPRVWYDANALAGRDLMAVGVMLLVISLALPRIGGLSAETYTGICAAILGLGGLVTTVRGWREANRLLRQRRDAP